MHLLNILQSIPRFALCSSISVQAAQLGRSNERIKKILNHVRIVLSHVGSVTERSGAPFLCRP